MHLQQVQAQIFQVTVANGAAATAGRALCSQAVADKLVLLQQTFAVIQHQALAA
jgi:hypothetical protein